MNAKMTTIALAIIATSAAAFAADPAVPGKTRAEVRAELEQAYAQGQPGQAKEYVEFVNVPGVATREAVRAELAQAQPAANTEYVEPPRIVGGKTRAEVRAELRQAYADGELAARNTEFVEFTHVASTRSRDEVRAEAARAANAGRAADYSGR